MHLRDRPIRKTLTLGQVQPRAEYVAWFRRSTSAEHIGDVHYFVQFIAIYSNVYDIVEMYTKSM